MSSAVKTLSFATRWPDIPVWRIVSLHFSAGLGRAEYVSGSERQDVDNNWLYDFMVQSIDLPAGVTLADVINANLISPFVTAYAPCSPVQTSCFGSLPVLGNGEMYQLAVVVGPGDCGQFCLKRTNAPDQYEHGGDWMDHPGQPAPV